MSDIIYNRIKSCNQIVARKPLKIQGGNYYGSTTQSFSNEHKQTDEWRIKRII